MSLTPTDGARVPGARVRHTLVNRINEMVFKVLESK